MEIKNWKKFNESNQSIISTYNSYMEIVEGIDGIISEHGELPSSCFESGLEEKIDELTAGVTEESDINVEGVKENALKLIDGIECLLATGRISIDRYFKKDFSISKYKAIFQ
jgi:hypothetical protein